MHERPPSRQVKPRRQAADGEPIRGYREERAFRGMEPEKRGSSDPEYSYTVKIIAARLIGAVRGARSSTARLI